MIYITHNHFINRYYFLVVCMVLGVLGQTQGLWITEIMYDPPASCPEYLEITNLTSNELPEALYRVRNSAGRKVEVDFKARWPVNESRLITSDRETFNRCYEEVDTGRVFDVDLFPLSNSGTSLFLEDAENTIDLIQFSPDNHNEMFSSFKGISLERIIQSTGENKWRSGFVQFGYRSPGFVPEWGKTSEFEINFSARVIYPGSSGRTSVLEIILGTTNVDGRVTIDVFDVNGIKIQTVADGVPVQGGELFVWNGISSSGQIYPEGVYLFWIYYFDVKGQKRIIKKTCVLSNS